MYLGDYIVIEEQTGPFSFRCCSVSTGTPFTAEIDPDKRHLFTDIRWTEDHPHACRFLRPDGDLIRCTIHRDSPQQCKFYRCVVMRISEQSGKEIGIVTGTLSLHSGDPALRAAYDAAMAGIRDSDPGAEERLEEFLRQRGYTIR
jgi:Fe-S-cluster containining protein